MPIPTLWRSLAGGLLLTMAVSASASAQQAPATFIPYTQRHAVFRPTFDIPTRHPLMETGFEYPTKPLFVRGYAGSLYGQGPREAYIPTGYGTGTIQAVGTLDPAPRPGLFGRLFHHH